MYYYLYAKYKDKVALVGKYIGVMDAQEVAKSQAYFFSGYPVAYFIHREELTCPISYSQLTTGIKKPEQYKGS